VQGEGDNVIGERGWEGSQTNQNATLLTSPVSVLITIIFFSFFVNVRCFAAVHVVNLSLNIFS
jgi:hypothetical protein